MRGDGGGGRSYVFNGSVQPGEAEASWRSRRTTVKPHSAVRSKTAQWLSFTSHILYHSKNMFKRKSK